MQDFNDAKICIEEEYGFYFTPSNFFYLQFLESVEPWQESKLGLRQNKFKEALGKCNPTQEVISLLNNVSYDRIEEHHEYQYEFFSNLAETFDLDQTEIKIIVSTINLQKSPVYLHKGFIL